MTFANTKPPAEYFAKRAEQIKLWLSTRIRRAQGPIQSLTNLIHESNNHLLPYEEEDVECNERTQTNLAKVYEPTTQNALPHIGTLTWQHQRNIYRTRGDLPHWQLYGLTYFITFVLHDRKQQFLRDDAIASIVEEAILHGAGKEYALDAYVIMPDHVHVLVYLLEGRRVTRAFATLKSYIARKANQSLGRTGRFWQHEHFDHMVRNGSYWIKYFDYIHYNPVKAGLVSTEGEYKYSSLTHLYGTSSD